MQTYLQLDYNEKEAILRSHRNDSKLLWKNYEYYSFGEFKLFCVVCTDKHFFLVTMTFNANDPTGNIFHNVNVYDSLKLVSKGRQSKSLQFQSTSAAAKFL
jgi:uncharacterized protein YhbP (UPF0306 family)